MKSSKYFIGAFFISAGILWLNYYFDLVTINTDDIYKYWPLYLVILGLSMLNLPKFFRLFFSFIAGILTSLLIYSAVIYLTGLNQIEQKQLEEKIEQKIEKYFDNDKI